MNALTLAAILFTYLVLSQSMAAFIETETTPDFELGECETVVINNNQTTECSNPDGPSFVESIASVTVTGIDGAPDWFNGFWVGIHIIILVLAIGLAIAFFVGLLFGGSA